MDIDKQQLEALLRQACAEACVDTPVELPTSVALAFVRLVRAAAAAECESIALVHQQVDGPYAAGKKAGALECAALLGIRLI